MPFDFKKGYKEFCLPPHHPQIVEVPPANGLAHRPRVIPL